MGVTCILDMLPQREAMYVVIFSCHFLPVFNFLPVPQTAFVNVRGNHSSVVSGEQSRRSLESAEEAHQRFSPRRGSFDKEVSHCLPLPPTLDERLDGAGSSSNSNPTKRRRIVEVYLSNAPCYCYPCAKKSQTSWFVC